MLCHIIVFIKADSMPWQILLPYDVVVDVLTTEDVITFIYQGGRCYCLVVIVADVQNHTLLQDISLTDVIAKWQME